MKILLLAVLSCLILAGCSTTPETISTEETQSLTSYETVSQSKSPPIGAKARWGGKIVSVENKKDVSEIEVIYFPTNSVGRPKLGEASLGRFKAVVNGFVDPLVFESGRSITILGEVGNFTTDLIGEQEYQYPTIDAAGYHMWKEVSETEVETVTYASFGIHPRFGRFYYSRWYDPFWYDRGRVKVRVTKNNGHKQGATAKRSKTSSNKGGTKQSSRE